MTQVAEIRVLLVEDNPGDARLVEILLSEDDAFGRFGITPAERLDEALEHLDDSTFDVILLDLSLPDSSGLETVEVVRTRVPLTPLVVLTGRDDEETALRALQSGAEDYLVKGRGDSELMARSIRYAIERKKAEENLAHLKSTIPSPASPTVRCFRTACNRRSRGPAATTRWWRSCSWTWTTSRP